MQNEIFNQTVNQINFDNMVRLHNEQHSQFVSRSNSNNVSNSNGVTEHQKKYAHYQAEIEAMRARIKASR